MQMLQYLFRNKDTQEAANELHGVITLKVTQ